MITNDQLTYIGLAGDSTEGARYSPKLRLSADVRLFLAIPSVQATNINQKERTLLSNLPQLLLHVYWLEKEQFELREDEYEDWVLFLVEAGSLRYRIGKYEGIAGVGDIVICPPNSRFEREVVSAVTFHFLRFACESTADHDYLCGRIRLPNQIRVAHNSADLRAYALDRSAFALQYREHLLQDLWLMVVKETQGNPEFGSKSVKMDPVMQQVKDYLEEHAFEPLQLKNVAAAYHLTPVQLSRSFQSCYRQKPIDFITELRMQQAVKLLMTRNWTVDAIAQACGYENGFYLSRVFSKHMKMSPSAFRKENRV